MLGEDIEIEMNTQEEVWPPGVRKYLENALGDPLKLRGMSQKGLDYIQNKLKKKVTPPAAPRVNILPIIDKPQLKLTDGETGVEYNNVDDYLQAIGAKCTICCTPCNVEAAGVDSFIAHLLAHSWKGAGEGEYEEIALEHAAALDSEEKENENQLRREEIESNGYRILDDVGLIVKEKQESEEEEIKKSGDEWGAWGGEWKRICVQYICDVPNKKM